MVHLVSLFCDAGILPVQFLQGCSGGLQPGGIFVIRRNNRRPEGRRYKTAAAQEHA
jgi:hypothetical protein